MNLTRLATRSLINRRATAILTIFSIAVSVMLLLGVEKVRTNARESFANTISGTDLIVGGRSGSVQLLLYSIFRMGSATSDIAWESYQDIATQPGVKWTVPLALGDSHRGFRVIGTNADYFRFYRYGRDRELKMSEGHPFTDTMDVVLGAQVADTLGYKIGDQVVVSHGVKTTSYGDHKDKPFRVSGILKPTGTPVDRSLHITLEGVEEMHEDWQNKMDVSSIKKRREGKARETESVTAFLVGLESKTLAFKLQRYINEYPEESLLAIFPGVALHELWSMMNVAERVLLAISTLVVAASLIGMLAVSLAGLNERRREIAILRSLGASHRHIVGLLVAESTMLTLTGIIVGLILLYSGLLLAQPLIETYYGLLIPLSWLNARELYMILILTGSGFLIGLIPAWRAYHNSLLDGMTARI
ncbi:MAG: ABC transporter permease [Gammaproteobacteria bacterium]|nr:ABC transporter permease [Gammaproteobacteria bacterium]